MTSKLHKRRQKSHMRKYAPMSSTQRCIFRLVKTAKRDKLKAIKMYRELGYRINESGEKVSCNLIQRLVYQKVVGKGYFKELDKDILKYMFILSR